MKRVHNDLRVRPLEASLQRALPNGEITETALHLCPELKLHLMRSDHMRRRFSAEETQVLLSHPPYWALCWASGQALACHILRNKALVEGKRVLDFGAGSGVAAIAAAMAGATQVIACDSDPDAITAIKANAALNEVQVHACKSLDDLSFELDLILAADVLYDRENLPFLQEFLECAPEILVADSRIRTIEARPYRKITEIVTSTIPDLDESDEFRRVSIFQAFAGRPREACQQCS
jgi:predicted nicotinamide N-methyase